jgi:hypothetical protein
MKIAGMPRRKSLIRCLALIVLAAICTQMAVCMSEDYRGAVAGQPAPTTSDCSCHDCGCCSLHTGFPPRAETFPATLIERLPEAPTPRLTEKNPPRLDHPPRS